MKTGSDNVVFLKQQEAITFTEIYVCKSPSKDYENTFHGFIVPYFVLLTLSKFRIS